MSHLKFYSQVGQDKFIYETFFKDQKQGTFLDIGAHDGVNKSNSLFFEKSLGWKGICVEPIPEVYARLIMNRECVCINAGVSDKNGTTKFWRIEGYSEMLSGIEENYNDQHKARIEKEIQEHNGKKIEIDIKIYDINTLLKEHNYSHVDYCTIDVEGSEEKILSVLNEKEFDFTVFTIENNYQDKSLRKLMKSKGYKLHSVVDFDDVYVKRKKWWIF
jgi:FkbM family methyltransferase